MLALVDAANSLLASLSLGAVSAWPTFPSVLVVVTHIGQPLVGLESAANVALGQRHHDLLVNVGVAEEGPTHLAYLVIVAIMVMNRQLRVVPDLPLVLNRRKFLLLLKRWLGRLCHHRMLPAHVLRGHIGGRTVVFLLEMLIDERVDRAAVFLQGRLEVLLLLLLLLMAVLVVC